MILSISKQKIVELLEKQLDSLFCLTAEEAVVVQNYIDVALDRCKLCFSKNPNKYYFRDNESYFNSFHSGQYMIFLYYLSNSISRCESDSFLLCDKIYYLNKALNGLDLFYAVDLPDFFMCEHPVGTVLGRAKYSNGFAFFQNCTVGGNMNEDYPTIGSNVTMFANSKIIGRSNIGNNVFIGADACVKDTNVPDNSIVFGLSPKLIIKEKTHNKSGF